MRSLDWRRRQPMIKSSRLTESQHLNSIPIETEHPLQHKHFKNLDKPTLVLAMSKVVLTMTGSGQRINTARGIKTSLSTVMTSTLKIFSRCSSRTKETLMIYQVVSLCKWASNSKEVEIGTRIILTLTNSSEVIPNLGHSACPEEASHFLRHLALEVLVNRGREGLLNINRSKIHQARMKETFAQIKRKTITEILTKISTTSKIIDKQEENRITIILKLIHSK